MVSYARITKFSWIVKCINAQMLGALFYKYKPGLIEHRGNMFRISALSADLTEGLVKRPRCIVS